MGDEDRIGLRRADRQALLMARMMEALDVAPSTEADAARREFEALFRRCARCAESRLCQAWLDGDAPDADYRVFCPNASLFARLKLAR
ncbi:MAG: hypothetical protein JJT90_03045 [Ectothiorhodospiraceae bacterium]|nr:hypothetical protein [Ectothiorhodospiraceae bacterium]